MPDGGLSSRQLSHRSRYRRGGRLSSMQCPRCQHDAPSDAEFCPECGTKLVAVCAKCGTANASGHKFCKKCGQPLTSAVEAKLEGGRFGSPESYTPKHLAEKILTSKSALEGERKQVTVLF